MSDTLNSFQIALVGPGQWIGEDILFTKGSTHSYTVQALTNVSIYEISKQELIAKFPQEFTDKFIKLIFAKYKWLKERCLEISCSSKEISNLHPKSLFLDENLAEFTRKYPNTTKSTLMKIRNKFIIQKSKEISPKISGREELNKSKSLETEKKRKLNISSFSTKDCESKSIFSLTQRKFADKKSSLPILNKIPQVYQNEKIYISNLTKYFPEKPFLLMPFIHSKRNSKQNKDFKYLNNINTKDDKKEPNNYKNDVSKNQNGKLFQLNNFAKTLSFIKISDNLTGKKK